VPLARRHHAVSSRKKDFGPLERERDVCVYGLRSIRLWDLTQRSYGVRSFFPFSLSVGTLKMGVRPSVFVFASHVSCALGRYGMQNAFSPAMIHTEIGAGEREGSNW
jgi:hypothetical protein